MKPSRKRLDALEAHLFASRRAADGVKAGEPAVPDGWRDAVMADARRSAAAAAASMANGNGEAFLVRLSWRFAAVAGVVALAFIVHLFLFGIIDYSELIANYIDSPINYLI